ncbi:Probable RNA-directed DNA polymerase from transposon BS [Eumeta japonica]|uniref:Probable RNA-directed DNA polymerase from transposon BS n=1 Tax=Eumeta variegata TaxID=151549 RepID=A0A4C1XDG9_EUMVA|nr:Probable RNA-directed DNA polymerase from transposon BS [Eumeta japonica]
MFAESRPHNLEHLNHVKNEVLRRSLLPPKDNQPLFSADKVQKLIKDLKPRKAPCLDGRPETGETSRPPTSYRPISLLSSLGKLFEKVLKIRLSDYLLGNDLIINKQYEFKPNHSCPQQALRLVAHILEGFKRERKTVAVIFDVATYILRQSMHTVGYDVHSASLRPRRPQLTLPTPDSAKQLLQENLQRTLAQTPPYYDLKRLPTRYAPRAPGTRLGDLARAEFPRDFLCPDAHLMATIGQSRADGIPCLFAAIDEVLKSPIYWGYGQQPSNMLFFGP